MRSILMTMMLIVVIIALYEAAIGGEGGAGQRVQNRGDRIPAEIGGIDP